MKDNLVKCNQLLSVYGLNCRMTVINSMIVIWCIIAISVDCRIYPVHSGLDPISANTCYPDEVFITDTYSYYVTWTAPYTAYNGKCIKCTQFAPTAQKCSIVSVRTNIISIQVTQQFYDQNILQPGFFECNQDNGYKSYPTSSKICGNEVMMFAMDASTYQHVCYNTIINCYQCQSSTSCDVCQYGYYIKYNSPNKECESLNSLNPNCWKANDNKPTQCIACQPGYYRQHTGSGDYNCTVCSGNCKECLYGSGVCTICKYGYQYPSDNCTSLSNLSCGSDRPTCKQCISRTAPSGNTFPQCISCNDNSTQFLNRQGTKCTTNCTVAQPHCIQCYTSQLDNLPKCRQCKQGFYVNWHGGCQSCQAPMPYCSKCQHSRKCTQCMMQMAYLKNDYTCQLCSANVSKCRLCQLNSSTTLSTTPFQCLKCQQGYYVDASSGQCKVCTTTGCRVCNNDGTCLACKNSPPKYYLTSSNICQTCGQIITNCTLCQTNHKYSNQTQCLQCNDNSALYLPSGATQKLCGPCSKIDVNCIQCLKGNLCTSCQSSSGTYLQKSSNTCQPCVAPCQTCQTKFKCLTCSEKYLVIVDPIKGKCGPCWDQIPNCQQCILTSSNQYQCTKCKSSYICHNNPNASPQCTPCQYDQYPYYGPTNSCKKCQGKCLTCYNATTCKSCISAYYAKLIAYNTVQCIDLCGDQSLITLPCDLWKGNISDGCTSECQVQKDFICQLYYSKKNSSVPNQNNITSLQNYIDNLPRSSQQHYYSICSFNGSVHMTVERIMKQKFENIISFQIKLVPFLFAYTLLTEQEINSLISVTYQTVSLSQPSITTKLSPQNQSIIVTIYQQQSFLEPLTLTLSHGNITTDPRKFKYTTDSFIKVNTKDQRSLSAFYYTDGDLKLWNMVHIAMQILSIVVLGGALMSICLKNLAGMELLWILQSMYISLFWYDQPLSLPLYSLAGLSYSHGYNPQSQISRTYNTQTINSTRLLYTYRATSGDYSSVFVQVPYMVVLFLLMYFLSYFGWVCKDIKNPKVRRWSKYFQEFFYNDALLIVGVFQLLNLLNQAFLLRQNWQVISPQSQFYSAILTFFGLCCQFLIITKWFKTNHLGYEKVQQGIIPYELFFTPFSRHNFPILRQKFYSLYIIVMVLASVACAFGQFYPMMPCLLYVFLAFLIEFYQPYTRRLSNHRAAYYSLVIGYGYFLRVIYLFSYEQNSSTLTGIVEHNRWTIWLWFVLLLIALTLFFIDVISTYRENQKQKEKRQQQFRQNLQRQDKQFQIKMLQQQAKKYQSHKGNLENVLLYPNFNKFTNNDNDGKKSRLQKRGKNRQQVKQQPIIASAAAMRKNIKQTSGLNNNINNKNSNNNKAKKDIKSGYSSINNNKNKPKPSYKQQHEQQILIDQQTLGNKQWLLNKKQQINQQKLRKQQQKVNDIMKSAYGFVNSIFEQKQQLIKQKQRNQQQQTLKPIKQRLVKHRIQQQYERHFMNPVELTKPQFQLELIENDKGIKKQELDKYKLQKAVDKHRPVYSKEGNFPHVEVYYKKAQRLNQQQLEVLKAKKHKKQQQNVIKGQVYKKKRTNNNNNNTNNNVQESSLQPKTIKLNQLKEKLKIMTIDDEQQEKNE